jgi:hypothetical protein
MRAITSGSANWATLLLENGDGSWHVTNDNTGTFNIGTSNDPSDQQKLTIASTGAATFSSSVTANGLVVLGSNSSSTPYALGSSTPRFQLMNGGVYGLAGDVLTNGNTYLQSQRTDGNTTAYNLLLQPLGGNVGIGTTSPVRLLNLYDASTPVFAMHNSTTTINADRGFLMYVSGSDTYIQNKESGGILGFITGGNTERMRITSGGDLIVGATSIPGAGSSTTGVSLGASGYITAQRAAATVGYFGRSNDGELFAFYNNTTQVGNISVAASSTSYNTSSDYRLKQDLKDFSGLDLVTKIKTYDYEWKADKTRNYGVIAHELQSVINYAVTGVKDGKEMQGVDYSKIVPVLIKAIQELNDKIK